MILSNDVFNERTHIVISVALTGKQSSFGFPLALEIESAKLPKKSWTSMGQIRTLSAERIGKKLSLVSIEEIERIIDGLNEITGT